MDKKNFHEKAKISVGLLVLTAFLIVSWVPVSHALSKKDLRRINDEGPVEVILVYTNPLQKNPGGELSFDVALETHSVDLSVYKMETISFLRIDEKQEQKALGWFNPGGGGHHISGVLKFAGPVPEGAKSIQVIVRGVGDVEERVFEWKLPLE